MLACNYGSIKLLDACCIGEQFMESERGDLLQAITIGKKLNKLEVEKKVQWNKNLIECAIDIMY